MKRILVLVCMLIAACGLAAELQSWKEIANSAVMSGDYPKAIQFYIKWVEADPTDAVSFYNLACCYAVNGKPDSAMIMLSSAVEVGWSDSTHTMEDPDLLVLHKQPGFRKLLENCARNERMKNSAYTSRACEQNRLGRYVVILPEEYDPRKSYPLIMLLHGYGDSPEEFSKVADFINRQDFIYALPEGSYPLQSNGEKGFSHFREMENYQEDTASARSAAEWVVYVANDMLKHYPISGKKFSVVGFSQGGALAHLVAAYYPERVEKYCAHGGYYMKGTISDKQLAAEKKAGINALLTHGKDDQVVKMEEAIYANNMLKQAGVTMTFTMVEGAHEFTRDVGSKVNDFLKAK